MERQASGHHWTLDYERACTAGEASASTAGMKSLSYNGLLSKEFEDDASQALLEENIIFRSQISRNTEAMKSDVQK